MMTAVAKSDPKWQQCIFITSAMAEQPNESHL